MVSKLAKCKKIFYFIKRNVPFTISARRKLLLYQSLVLSILLYGCSVWQPSVTFMRKLEKFQSRVFRWMASDRDYVSALRRLSYQFATRRLSQTRCCIGKWSINKPKLRLKHKLVFSTRSSTLWLFSVPKMQKFCSDDNFCQGHQMCKWTAKAKC